MERDFTCYEDKRPKDDRLFDEDNFLSFEGVSMAVGVHHIRNEHCSTEDDQEGQRNRMPTRR